MSATVVSAKRWAIFAVFAAGSVTIVRRLANSELPHPIQVEAGALFAGVVLAAAAEAAPDLVQSTSALIITVTMINARDIWEATPRALGSGPNTLTASEAEANRIQGERQAATLPDRGSRAGTPGARQAEADRRTDTGSRAGTPGARQAEADRLKRLKDYAAQPKQPRYV